MAKTLNQCNKAKFQVSEAAGEFWEGDIKVGELDWTEEG